MQKIIEWLKNYFSDEYEVSIWYDDPKQITIYNLKSITKLTSTTLKGKTASGHIVELQVQSPFNYQVKKIH